MIRRWLMSLLEADVRALVRDEVDLYLLDLGLDDRLEFRSCRPPLQPDHPWRQCEPPLDASMMTWDCLCGRRWRLSEHTSGPTQYFSWDEETETATR